MKHEANSIKVYSKDNVDLLVNFEGVKGGSVIYFDKNLILFGRNNSPYALITTINFDEADVPENFKNEIYQVREILVKPSLINEVESNVSNHSLPKWLDNFSNAEKLVLKNIDVSNFYSLKLESVNCLVLEDVSVPDINELIRDLSNLKNLKYLVYKNSFSPGVIEKIKTRLPELIIKSKLDYNRECTDKIELNKEFDKEM